MDDYDAIIERASDLQLWTFVAHALAVATNHSDNLVPSDSLKSTGSHLCLIGTLPKKSFEEFIRLERFEAVCRHLAEVHVKIDSMSAYPEWQLYLKHCAKRLEDELRGTALSLGSEVTNIGGLEVAQHFVRKYGEVMTIWPELTMSAKEIAEELSCIR